MIFNEQNIVNIKPYAGSEYFIYAMYIVLVAIVLYSVGCFDAPCGLYHFITLIKN